MAGVDDWREILVLAAADEAGLLAGLATPVTTDDLADGLGLDRRAVRITVAALIDRGWVVQQAACVALSARGRAVAGDDVRDPLLAEMHLAAREIAAYLQLPATLRTGRPPHDVSAGDLRTRQRFLEAMRAIAARRAPATIAALPPPPEGGRLLDVGGGPGTYAQAFARAGWDVTVVDLTASLEIGGAELARAGISQIAADVTRQLPEGPWDAVYLGNVTHLFGPEAAEDLIVRAGAQVAHGGRLAIQEVVRGLAEPAALFAVAMLVGTEQGDVYDQATYARWMDAAGCPIDDVVTTESERHHLLIGVRR